MSCKYSSYFGGITGTRMTTKQRVCTMVTTDKDHLIFWELRWDQSEADKSIAYCEKLNNGYTNNVIS